MDSGQLTKFLEVLIAKLSNMPMLPIFLLFSLIGLVAGLFIAFNPLSAIKMQAKFYEKINWKIEPISLPKEIRNTRIMGYFLIILLLLILILVLSNKATLL
jgi:hypothetical protein